MTSMNPTTSRALLYLSLGVHLLQTVYFFPRLPAKIASKFDLDLNPSRYTGKAWYMGLTLVAACGMIAAGLVAPPVFSGQIAAVLLFVAVVNQYVYAANLAAGRLHRSFMVIMILGVALLIAVFLSMTRRPAP